MITEKKNQDNEQPFRGLENDVPQNHGLSQDYQERESISDRDDNFGNPVTNGGVGTIKLDPRLEEQWRAVRDGYLAHYPDLKDAATEYEKGSFHAVINSFAKKRQRTPKEIHDEIMDWSH